MEIESRSNENIHNFHKTLGNKIEIKEIRLSVYRVTPEDHDIHPNSLKKVNYVSLSSLYN